MLQCARRFSPGSEPVFFGAFTAANKIASGLSGAIIGYTLMWLGIGNDPISMERQARSLYWLVYIYPIAGAAIGIGGIGLFTLLAPTRRPRLPPVSNANNRSDDRIAV